MDLEQSLRDLAIGCELVGTLEKTRGYFDAAEQASDVQRYLQKLAARLDKVASELNAVGERELDLLAPEERTAIEITLRRLLPPERGAALAALDEALATVTRADS